MVDWLMWRTKVAPEIDIFVVTERLRTAKRQLKFPDFYGGFTILTVW
jgi:hypothetical protein